MSGGSDRRLITLFQPAPARCKGVIRAGDAHDDAILVALWNGLGRRPEIRAAVLDELSPADREDIRYAVVQAQGRIAARNRAERDRRG